ncbi:TetR/AcrR family transcriptional regulator [Ornithinibacillus bavariensis]|uniref:TetR/AcrR family transcriptional regulator n=1 Tax=Ornithinibacillus bavariensis TaxID=545502 RepID=UPI000ECD5D56|nr:TetR/AcrR family transcriptional regulator [Ornithinibacillus sp.]
MPRTEEQYEAMRIATRDKIHSAAIKLFAKKGFAATSVKDIAEGAGISIGLMYRHYKKKEDLFNELVTFAVEGLYRNAKRFQSDNSPAELIQQFTLEILNDLEKDDEYAQFHMLMYQSMIMEDSSPQIQNLNKMSELLFYQITQLIEKGQKLGQFKQGNASELAFFYFASIQGMTMLKVLKSEQYTTLSPQIVTAFLFKEDSGD